MDLDRLGGWVRMGSDGIRLRAAPSLRADVLRELEQHVPLRVLGGSGDYFRVRLPDGVEGYVAARLTEGADVPVASQVVVASEPVRLRPAVGAPAVAQVDGGTEVPVLGRYGDYLYVRSPGGATGWVSAQPAAQDDG